MSAFACEIPLVISTESVVNVRHTTVKTGESEVGISSDSVALTKKVIVLLLSDVLTLVNTLDCKVCLTDHMEQCISHRLRVSLRSIECDTVEDILIEITLLEINLTYAEITTVSSISSVHQRQTMESVQVLIEREGKVDRSLVLTSIVIVAIVEITREVLV